MPICTLTLSSDHHVQQTAHPRDRRWTWFLFEVSPKHPDWWSVQLPQTAASLCCPERASVGPMPVKFFPACLPEYFRVYLLLIFYLLALWPVCTAQPEGRGPGMLRFFKFYPWSPCTDTKPFLCEAASLTATATGVSIATSSYFYFKDKCPELWSSALFFNVTSTKMSLRTTLFTREVSWRP